MPHPHDGGLTVTTHDEHGTPVLTVDRLVMRPVPADLRGTTPGTDALYTLDWTPVAADTDGAPPTELGPDLDLDAITEPAERLLAAFPRTAPAAPTAPPASPRPSTGRWPCCALS